jgi:hypothetical protein
MFDIIAFFLPNLLIYALRRRRRYDTHLKRLEVWEWPWYLPNCYVCTRDHSRHVGTIESRF